MANGENMVRLPAGAEYDIDQYGDFPLYSVLRGIGSTIAAPNLYCFNYQRGGAIPITGGVANGLDTNLDQGDGRLGYTEEMMVHGVCWEYPMACVDLPADPAIDHPFMSDMIEVSRYAYYQLQIAAAVYAEGVLHAFPFFGGLHVVTTENVSEYVNNGMPQSLSARPLALPIHITGKSKIVGQVSFPDQDPTINGAGTVADGEDYRFRNWLMGIRARYRGTSRSAQG